MKPQNLYRWIHGPARAGLSHVPEPPRARGYVLLETVIATALLILGLAVVGAQVQDAYTSIKKMELRTRALMQVESFLSEMAMGLIEIDALDEMQEEEFELPYLDWGWRMTIDDTEVDTLYLVKLEMLYQPREDEHETFEYDEAEVVDTFYLFQTAPQKVNLAEAFGVPEDKMEELSEKLGATGIEGLDPEDFDPSVFATGFEDFDQFIEAMPVLLDAFGVDISSLAASLPPEILEVVREAGLLEEPGGEDESKGP